ncbi:DUF4097 family beta strand repeat protein [Sulfolobus sp. E5-1-F]|uniref:DUF4097 family beta strand repeat-containing protein n=1 Tax=Saccharolobus sp. E5-1-F TaxID=2663019 RepID=UPI001297610E|nr:DUF4097 family beta strand repeat-containing protein [Sulfolobus sp. E5-1-F]QGA54082.1 DUF4097 family beta strand repeat protein [Sulfolobus sp. E5-1-F]
MIRKSLQLALIIFILVIGVVAVALFFYPERVESEIASINPDIKGIYVVDIDGNVSITRDNSSTLHITVYARGLLTLLSNIKVSFYTSNDILYVYVRAPINFFQSVNICLELPTNYFKNVTVNVINGEIYLYNISSRLIYLESDNGLIKLSSTNVSEGYIFTSNGVINLENSGANFLNAVVRNGEIILNFTKNYPNSTYLIMVSNGNIKVYTNVPMNIFPTVDNGEIYLNGERVSSIPGSGTNSSKPVIHALVGNGEIQIYYTNS